MLCSLRVLALGSLAVALTAAAEPHPMLQKAFGNTIVSTYPDNREGKLWLAPEGTYTAVGPPGDRTRGRWRIKGDTLCLRQEHPAVLPFLRYCTELPEQDAWTTRAITGETIKVRVVKGIVGAP
jgi:hypothetical protein